MQILGCEYFGNPLVPHNAESLATVLTKFVEAAWPILDDTGTDTCIVSPLNVQRIFARKCLPLGKWECLVMNDKGQVIYAGTIRKGT